MKGARGLLISITGGSDLTLYEVDEAATRIREEVDQDANVIFGATRDDSLEGIVRVSVVATGIEQEFGREAPPALEPRVAEITERLRNDARQRQQEIQQAAAQRAARIETPIDTTLTYQPQPAPAAYQQPQPAMESAPLPQTHHDVNIRAVAPKPVMHQEPMMERAPVVEHHPHPQAFIPPRAEEVIRPTRMPRVDELPIPAQRQIEQRGQQIAAPQPEKKRVTLMERLAQAGFGRKHEEQGYAPQAPAPAPVQRAPQQQPQPQAYAPQQQPLPASPVHQEYAKRPSAPVAPRPQQGLDPHGRTMAPQQRASEDDHLEIPAFLRRQSN
jgi:cell division protein FtsZ